MSEDTSSLIAAITIAIIGIISFGAMIYFALY